MNLKGVAGLQCLCAWISAGEGRTDSDGASVM